MSLVLFTFFFFFFSFFFFTHPASPSCFQSVYVRLIFVGEKRAQEGNRRGNEEGNGDGKLLRHVSYPLYEYVRTVRTYVL